MYDEWTNESLTFFNHISFGVLVDMKLCFRPALLWADYWLHMDDFVDKHAIVFFYFRHCLQVIMDL